MRIILGILIILTTAAALYIIVAANERGVRKYYAPVGADSAAPRVDVSTIIVAVFATVLFLAAVVIPAGAHSLAQLLG